MRDTSRMVNKWHEVEPLSASCPDDVSRCAKNDEWSQPGGKVAA